MAKKSTAARQTNAARRPQTAAKAPDVALVRAPKSDAPEIAGSVPVEASTRPASATAQRPSRTLVPAERPKAPQPAKVAKPVTATAETVTARQQAARAQTVRAERARAAQRARNANLISPTHYQYVLNDLRVIGALALMMFAVIVILHFVLP